jgi:carbamoyl-phosphate synthase large subunit
MGYELVGTRGTAIAVEADGIPIKPVNKVKDGRPHVVDLLKNGAIDLVITTVSENRAQIADSRSIRTTALAQRVTYYTTISGGRAAVEGMRHLQELAVYDLQGLHGTLASESSERMMRSAP